MLRTYQDVRQLLIRFGCLIYMGSRLYDIEMSQIEIRRLYEAGLLDKQELASALAILEEEHAKELRYQQTKEQKSLEEGSEDR